MKITEIIRHFQSGMIDKEEMFIVFARNVDQLGNGAECLQIFESEAAKQEFLEWLTDGLLAAKTLVMGGVGEVFSQEEISAIRNWHNRNFKARD